MRLPRPEDLSRLAESPAINTLGGAVRGTRDKVLRAVLRSATPDVDGSPIDGGRGPHPLRAADLPPFDAGPLASLGQAALAAGRGQATGLDAAISFVAGDRPGQGPDWTDPGDVACRLIHLAAVHAWSRAAADQAAALGGSARAHATWLLRERPFDEADPSVTLGFAALVVAGHAWPSLPEAATWRSAGLGGLGPAAVALVGEDGAPAASEPDAAARALWGLAIARAWAKADGGAIAADATGALIQGATALWRLAGDTGSLPSASDAVPGLLPLGPAPTWATLRDLVLGLGLEQGPRASADPDPAVLRLAGRSDGEPPQLMAPDKDWVLWSWRGAGVAVAHAAIKGQRGRGWFRQHDGLLSWELDGVPVVRGIRAPIKLTVARCDGPKARVIAVPPSSDPFADARPERDILFRQARCIITDRGTDRIEWTLGRGWSLALNDRGEWTGELGDRTLVVKLDDDGWSWTVSGGSIVGQGDPRMAVRSIFELR